MKTVTKKYAPLCFVALTLLLGATGLAEYIRHKQPVGPGVRAQQKKVAHVQQELKALKARFLTLKRQKTLTPIEQTELKQIEAQLAAMLKRLTPRPGPTRGSMPLTFTPPANDNCATDTDVTNANCPFTAEIQRCSYS